ncbi:MAG: hypothetical protein GX879_07495 [Bacteroidales bacterium]|nr:hypothetical protein [Bacteroidales bacterium]
MDLYQSSPETQENIDEIMNLSRTQPEKIQVIEAQVDIDVQLDYFDTLKNLTKEEFNQDIDELIANLSDINDYDLIKKSLVQLSGKDDVRAYRAVESFVEKCPKNLKAWCILAYQQSKMMLETSLLEESKVFVSSALGGIGNKIRYSVGILLKESQEISSYQKDLLKKETKYFLEKDNGLLETVSFTEQVAFITCLIPLHVNVQDLFQNITEEVNLYGDFLQGNITITNAKHLQISDLIED